MKKLKFDFLILIFVLFVAALFYIVPRLNGNVAEEVIILSDKMIIGSYPLTEDVTVPIKGPDGGYNLLMIQNGVAQISDADCPDQLCVKQSPISSNHESIICLPHKLVIKISSGKDSGIDAVTN